jgi:hypothetical protein
MRGLSAGRSGCRVRRPGVWSALALLLVAGCATVRPPSAASAPHPNFNGLWKMASAEITVKPEDDQSVLTDEAVRRHQAYAHEFDTAIDTPDRFCMPHGMPWIMVSRVRDYLIDIYQTDERVTMLFEGMDVHRLIRLDQSAVPDGFTPGTNGYSLAHWDGATLVIETSHLRPSNPAGAFQRSGAMHITERWRLIEHPKYGRALEVDLTVTDPVIYRHPAHGYQLYVPAEPGSVLNAYGCPESLWDDYVGEHEAKRVTPTER